jgi:hypothetical protein
MPAPTTTASTAMSLSSGGRSTAFLPSNQSDWITAAKLPGLLGLHTGA